MSQGGPELLENKWLCEMFRGSDSSSVSFGPSPLQLQCAQMSGDIVEKWIVRFNPPGSFVAVGGWIKRGHSAAWPVLVVTLHPGLCKLLLFPVMLDEEVLCNSVPAMLGDGAQIFLQWWPSCCCQSPLFFSPGSDDDEEMLISEEEVPFKDDPRDETYKPHLEKYIRLCTYWGFRPKKNMGMLPELA